MADQPSLDAPQVEAPESAAPFEDPPSISMVGQPVQSGQLGNGRKPTMRTHLALLIVVAAALFSLIQSILYYQPESFISFFQEDRPLPSDFVTRNERLLRCISADMPSGEVIGFITDLEGSAHRERYRITQYVLAPALVDDSTDHTYIIGIFSTPNRPYPLDPQVFSPLVSCGTGIYLIQNNSAP